MILSDPLILPVSQLQRQQVMTSLIRSHHRIINTDLSYPCAHFVVELMKYRALMARFNTILMMIRDSGLLFGHPEQTPATSTPDRITFNNS